MFQQNYAVKKDNINKEYDLNKPLILQKYISKIMPKIQTGFYNYKF